MPPFGAQHIGEDAGLQRTQIHAVFTGLDAVEVQAVGVVVKLITVGADAQQNVQQALRHRCGGPSLREWSSASIADKLG